MELGEQVVEAVEALVPVRFEGLHPVVHRLQTGAVHAVEAAAADGPAADEVDRPQHPEVLRHLWLGEPEAIHDVAHGRLAPGEGDEDVAPARLGDGVEGVGGRSGSGHPAIIFRYEHVSSRGVRHRALRLAGRRAHDRQGSRQRE